MKKSTALRKALQLTMISAFVLGTVVNGYAAGADRCGGIKSPGNPFPCCSNGANCTWWAAKQAMDNWKISASQLPASTGSPNTWDNSALKNKNFYVSEQPVQANSMGIKEVSSGVLGKKNGHVVWIKSVIGNTITYSEMNCDYTPAFRDDVYKNANGAFDSYINYGLVLKDFRLKSDSIYSGQTNGFDAQFKLKNMYGKDIVLNSALSLNDATGNLIKTMQRFNIGVTQLKSEIQLLQ